MENTIIKTTPKDFFMHLLGFAALYASVVGFTTLIFAYIDFLFPDPLNYNYASYLNQIRLSSSALLILFLVFIIISRLLEKDFSLNPERRGIKFRKWLIYLTLFMAAVTVIIDLITLIYNFYSGELTAKFLLKVLTVLVSASAVFSYYFWDLKRENYNRENQSASDIDAAELSRQRSLIPKIAAWFSSLVVLAVIIAGFFIIGTPAQQRTRRFDEQRVSDLQIIQNQLINNYWTAKRNLPTDLSELKNLITGFSVPVDPETAADYGYKRSSSLDFELCAVFKTNNRNLPNPKPDWNPYSRNIWPHDKGQTCFERHIDPGLYPIPSSGNVAPKAPIY